jgi:SOS-response transcriptional repressor LexA
VTVEGQDLLASAGDDGTVRIWDPATGEPLTTLTAGHQGLISVMAADRSQRPVAAGDQVQETPPTMPGTSVVDHPARARVAEIIVSRVGNENTRGSGYLVSPGWVLTAHHVVYGAVSVGVWLGAPAELAPNAGVGVDPGRVLAVPAADLALLPVGGQADDPLGEPALLGRLDWEPGPPVPVAAAGCPRFKLRPAPDRPGVLLRELGYAIGSIAALPSKTGRFTFAVDVPPGPDPEPDKHSPWEGMSGAAVWASGRLIGVVGQHHPREGLATLTVCPIERLFGSESEDQLEAWRTALPQLPATAEDLWLATPPTVRKIEVARARRAAEALAPRVLIGRGAELAALEEFTSSGARWRWIQGDAGAGKTALLAWFALHPPERVDVAACFLRRARGEDTAEYALDVLTRQLALLADRLGYLPPQFVSERSDDFADLLEEAARACAQRGRRLLVLIDGLEEYDPKTTSLDLADWLPGDSTLPDQAMLLVASRTVAGVRLPPGHPLSSNVQRITAPGAGSAVQTDDAEGVTTTVARQTLIVGAQQPADFATISAAIQEAKPGDRILVQPGLYEAGLAVEKPLVFSVTRKAAASPPILTVGEGVESRLLPLEDSRQDNVFALVMWGDSMTGDGVQNGDYVLVDRNQVPKDGDIAVIRIGGADENEPTVKRLRLRRDGTVLLESSNPDYQPILLRPEDSPTIEGKVIAVLRLIR